MATGLGIYSRNKRIIDRFRDRLTFPIYGQGGDIHGFIGRRNRDRDTDDSAGPKYLNTAGNDLFTKGDQLFGLHEACAALASGATPVLVEGPIDAYAVTLACDGQGVGVAPLGTAFTDRQADQLRPYIGPDRLGVIVATDADPAGTRAAEHAYWQLTARGDDPRRLVMPDGMDPAAILHSAGRQELLGALTAAGSLAAHVIEGRLVDHAAPVTATDQSLTIRAAAEVIGALPPPRWLEHIEHVTHTLGAPPGSVHLAVIDAGTAWVIDPAEQARHRLDELARTPRPVAGHAASSAAPSAPAEPESGWVQLAARVDPRLRGGDDWPLLAAAISRAYASGYNVESNLPRLAAAAPLPERYPARELFWRLTADCPAAQPPTQPAPLRQEAVVPMRSRQHNEHAPVAGRNSGDPRGLRR